MNIAWIAGLLMIGAPALLWLASAITLRRLKGGASSKRTRGRDAKP